MGQEQIENHSTNITHPEEPLVSLLKCLQHTQLSIYYPYWCCANQPSVVGVVLAHCVVLSPGGPDGSWAPPCKEICKAWSVSCSHLPPRKTQCLNNHAVEEKKGFYHSSCLQGLCEQKAAGFLWLSHGTTGVPTSPAGSRQNHSAPLITAHLWQRNLLIRSCTGRKTGGLFLLKKNWIFLTENNLIFKEGQKEKNTTKQRINRN